MRNVDNANSLGSSGRVYKERVCKDITSKPDQCESRNV